MFSTMRGKMPKHTNGWLAARAMFFYLYPLHRFHCLLFRLFKKSGTLSPSPPGDGDGVGTDGGSPP